MQKAARNPAGTGMVDWQEALCGCSALAESAVHPALVAGERAFADTLLGERLENGMHVVGNLVVSGEACTGEMNLLDGVKIIEGIAPYAFAGNRALRKIVLPESVRWIGEGAFLGAAVWNRLSFWVRKMDFSK